MEIADTRRHERFLWLSTPHSPDALILKGGRNFVYCRNHGAAACELAGVLDHELSLSYGDLARA